MQETAWALSYAHGRGIVHRDVKPDNILIERATVFLWVLSVPEAAASVPVARALHFLIFLCGGPAFAVALGLMAAGVTVSSRFARLLPKWVGWLGLLIAATGALSTLGLLSLPMTVAIPVTRVGGFVWLIVVGALMPGRLSL